MAISIQRSQLAAKIESVEGTKETLANTDAFLVFDTSHDPDQKVNERDPHRETLSPLIPVPAERSGKISFMVELAGSGSPGVAPFWGKLMKACGFTETIVGGTSVTYTPASSSIPSLTLGLYRDGFVNRIWGARGSVKLDLATGKLGLLRFEFTGKDFERVDAALLTSVSYSAVVPPAFLSATFTAGGYAAIIDKLSLDLGNALALRTSPAEASGHVSALITGRKPKVSFDPEAVTVATKDFMGIMKAGTSMALNCVIGSAAGNIITITAPKLVISDLKEGNRNSILTDQITCLAGLNAGDDEISIALT
jgi:hypothetical protein